MRSSQWWTVATDHTTEADRVGERQRFCHALQVAHRGRAVSVRSSQGTGDAEHHRRRVDADDRGGSGRGTTDGDTRSAADVDDIVVGADVRQPDGEVRIGIASDGEGDGGDEAPQTGEGRVGGVVVGCRRGTGSGGRCGHGFDLDS